MIELNRSFQICSYLHMIDVFKIKKRKKKKIMVILMLKLTNWVNVMH